MYYIIIIIAYSFNIMYMFTEKSLWNIFYFEGGIC